MNEQAALLRQRPLRLTIPAPAIKRLADARIFCAPVVSLEYQHGSKRYVLRGRESGGAVARFGRYVGFCHTNGGRLPWLMRLDALTPNGEHAVVVAPQLVSVEVFRVDHTYDLLVARHEIEPTNNGHRPRVISHVIFRATQGQLPLDLGDKDRLAVGKIAPEFFSRSGERRPLPADFVEVIQVVTGAVNCIDCKRPHLLIAPQSVAAEATDEARAGA